MFDRVSTGISELDEMVEGGIKKGSITLLEGAAGCGKSTLAVHFCLSDPKTFGTCLYISVEEDKKSFFENMQRYGLNLQEHESSGDLIFHQLNSAKLKDFMNKGTLGIEDILVQNKVSRIVLDSISAFTLLYETEAQQRIAVQNLFEKLRVWNLTVFIVAEDSQDYRSFGLLYLVDGVLRMSYKKAGRQRVRTIEVLKMRGTKHRAGEVVYRIEDNGIVLYPREMILDSQT
ncbi:MAG: AAA family ATPase [Candidatus Altiarchaeota archaeon]|nr:AAA family ATPase [Candidatus Altiarchaeota archaeon]